MDSEDEKITSVRDSKKTAVRNKLLTKFYHEGIKSIPDLSDSLQLSIPTVTRFLEELGHAGYILEEGEGSSSGGRRPVLYGLNPNAKFVVSVDIGRFTMRIALVNLRNHFVAPVRIINEGLSSQTDLFHLIKRESEDLIARSGIPIDKILGAGIALPGLIDSKTGISYSYFTTLGKSLPDLFKEVFPFPVFIEHDTKAMALAELSFGLAKGKQNVLCLVIGAGVGLSMIMGGRLYKGNSGFAGEFGHIPVSDNGQLCYCGKVGCLETVASGVTLIQNARNGIASGASSKIIDLTKNNPEKITLEIIMEAAKMGDQYAIALLARTGESLGKGIATLLHLFNPEMIILGGELSKAGNYISDPIKQTLNQHAIARILRDTELVTTELGENATLMGTVALVINNFFTKGADFPKL
jgi:glucokinase-like ROK family protein